MKIRRFQPSDTPDLRQLFYDTVHAIDKDYSTKQLEVWASTGKRNGSWPEVEQNITFVAEIEGQIVGFGTITKEGYIDYLYTHKDFLRKGIASKILKELEHEAKCLELKRIHTSSSLIAKPFFESKGFHVEGHEERTRGGVLFTNFIMFKKI